MVSVNKCCLDLQLATSQANKAHKMQNMHNISEHKSSQYTQVISTLPTTFPHCITASAQQPNINRLL